ncbi:unnamed protein product [Rotaria sordida]|uniref:Metalloendopeptidase n=1 Tax=Rotaria sordida TaxID=392033 RepID=A0A816D6H3_9BILA|nr:unnamed protein product [Rotaria sordida]CAF1634141.1 unnamed protein product [Rotaria sordida]
MILPPGFDPLHPNRGVSINGQIRRWPNKIVPYDISAISDSRDRQTIELAMQKLMYDTGITKPGQTSRTSCVTFRPAQSTDRKVLKIQYGTGCSASVGYNTNYPNTVRLQRNGCFRSGIIQHELAHVLGFFHEQSRPDRDQYLTVHYENIQQGMAFNFQKYSWGREVENQGSTYDYDSLMHYGRNDFTKNGKPTLTPRTAGAQIGQREKLSSIDIAEIRRYYKCS